MISKRLLHSLLVLALGTFTGGAEVRLHNLFTHHMVLQQGTSVPVWGWADDGEQVTVEFRGQKASTTAKNGKWMVRLKGLKPGGPDTLSVRGNLKGQSSLAQIEDVLVGEVWIASGQSNMEWSMNRSFEPEKDIAGAANPHLRLFTVPKLKLNAPTNNVNGKWQECTPGTVPGFSAVAYYFARDLQKALQVPVGVIHTSWGGSPAEVWMREEVLAAHKDYKRDILDAFAPAHQRHLAAVKRWEQEKADAEKAGQAFAKRRPTAGWKPAELYNGMIAPIIPYAIQGAIWYQGESNAGRAWQYRTLFPDMIENWREDWDRDFTFLQVQLAPWDKNKKRSIEEITQAPGDSDWAELREAQLLATKKLKKVGMAVITDAGDKDDIHPARKEPVGARLALLARRIAYGEEITAEGPAFKRARFSDGKAILTFDHVDGGLDSAGGPLKGFAIAGKDQKFVWADARIEGDKVIVSSPQVSEPAAVRYGWADFPVVNLVNKAGLPASPFRTDDWAMITKPKANIPVKSP